MDTIGHAPPPGPEPEPEPEADDVSHGLRCPSCNCAHLPVYYTRRRDCKVQRVRQCRNCGRLIMTTERITG